MNILVIGGSRNIGYFSALKFLDAGHTVTFLLRSSAVFDNDQTIQAHIKSGKAHLVKGDALNKDDLKNAWGAAIAHGESQIVDLLLFTVGGTPKFNLLKGFVINPANLVTQSLLNTLSTMPSPTPKIITISSTGITRTSHASLPLLLKPMYGYLLAAPHKDKAGAERVIAHCAGWAWNADKEPSADIMGSDWKELEGLPAPGSLKRVLVLRPALFTDGECVADRTVKHNGKGKAKEPYRVSEAELGGYTISRKDVAHFIVDAALNRWDEFEGKRVNMAY